LCSYLSQKSGLSHSTPAGTIGSSLWNFISTLLSYVFYPLTVILSFVQRALPSSGGSGTGDGGPRSQSSGTIAPKPQDGEKKTSVTTPPKSSNSPFSSDKSTTSHVSNAASSGTSSGIGSTKTDR